MSPAQRDRLQQVRDLLDEILNARDCGNCSHFDPRSGRCGWWDAVVPVDARPAGCDNFDVLIPF